MQINRYLHDMEINRYLHNIVDEQISASRQEDKKKSAP